MARLLYTLATLALLPWALIHLLWRARRQPEYLRHWSERFGYFRGPRPAAPVRLPPSGARPTVNSEPPSPNRRSGFSPTDPSAPVRLSPSISRPTIWIHAVSVGETRAAQPLVALLLQRYPDYAILFSHMTPTGRATSLELFGDRVTRVYLPYDTPWAMRRFLGRFRPALGLIMETEIWPNLVAACRERGTPLLLVNARLSERSSRRYARFPGLARETLAGLAAVSAQSEDDRRLLTDLGAENVLVAGNMKFDAAPPPAQLELGRSLRTRIGARPVLLAASTREGEEELILDALRRRPIAGLLLLLVPRHPQRFDAVAALAAAKGYALMRRSENRPVPAGTEVLIGDSMGELFAYYAACDLALIGGSLLDYGSQNLIEACSVGAPLLLGPSTYNFAEAARAALACGAARRVVDADEAIAAAAKLLADEATRRAMGEAGREFAALHRGASERTLDLIAAFIPADSVGLKADLLDRGDGGLSA